MDRISIEGGISFSQIENLLIYGAVNEHGSMAVTGIITEETAQELINTPLNDGMLSVFINEESRPLFSGVIEEVQLSSEGNLNRAEVTCSSFTVLLDRELRSQSFQNTSMRYRDVLEKAGKNSRVRSRVLVTASNAKEPINQPIIQYQETDWEFMKRIAGQLHTIVIPEITYAMAQLSIGCVKGTRYELEEMGEYKKNLDLDECRRNAGNYGRGYFISYEIQSEELYELGDKIRWQGNEFIIMKKELQLKHSHIEASYVLGYEPAFCIPEHVNEKVRGISLPGIIIDRKEGKVKVHLDIDEEQGVEAAYWYRFSPVTGNIMYSVPEIGARVLLNIMNEKEEAVVSCCIRTDSNVLPKPETKMMWAGNKKYAAAPEYMGFACENSRDMEALFLDDELGIVMNTGKRLNIRAKGRILIQAEGNISMNGAKGIELCHPNAKNEQAWISMDCGRIRLIGESIVHSGGVVNGENRGKCEENTSVSTKTANDILGMIPIIWSETNAEYSRMEMQSANSMMQMCTNNQMNSYASKKTTGKVENSTETKDSAVSTKEAKVYINGESYNGYVNKTDNKTYLNQKEFKELKYLFGYVKIGDETEPLNIEDLAEIKGYKDVLSKWEEEENLRIVVCNLDAKNSHYKLIRTDNKVQIKLYTEFYYLKANDEVFRYLWSMPYLPDIDTVLNLFLKGMEMWEGHFVNKEENGICYDNFGIGGGVYTTVEVINFNKEGNRAFKATLIDNREQAFEGLLHEAIDIKKYYNNSITTHLGSWNIFNTPIMTIFMTQRTENNVSHRDKQGLIHTIAHETGHVMGLEDAYENEKQDEVVKTVETEFTMMNDKIKVMENDMEMVLEAWKTLKFQYYCDSIIENGYKKSTVIRIEKETE